MTSSSSPSARKIAGQIRHRLVLAFDEWKVQERTLLQKALTYIEEHYDKYRKKTRSYPERGVPIIVHPMRVALILIDELELKDTGAVTAALLHELVEWKREKVTIADIEARFGRPVAMLVSILTKPPIDANASKEERAQKLSIYHKRIEQASVVSKLVKLADRLDSIREAPDWLEEEKQRDYLEETRNVYIPLAESTDSYLHEELVAAADVLEEVLNTGNFPKPVGEDSSLS